MASVLFGVEGLQVTDADEGADGTVEVWAVTDYPAAAACPGCGTVSRRVHETVVTAALMVARRTSLKVLRTPQILVIATVQQVAFLLIFRYVGAARPHHRLLRPARGIVGRWHRRTVRRHRNHPDPAPVSPGTPLRHQRREPAFP
jgi:hypothetical protein